MNQQEPEYSSLPELGIRPILIVEDHEANIFVASLYMEELGYEFEVARTGNEAFEKFRSGKYSVILMDVEMPDLNGIDATRLIREFEIKGNLVPTSIIGITAHALSIHRERCLDAGMNDYISKPMNLDMLKKKLEHFIKLSNY